MREDYSPDGSAWDYFSHEQSHYDVSWVVARASPPAQHVQLPGDIERAYRWGEDGILGISDNHQRLCFAIALWNGQDPMLKERMFGLTGSQGNHGENVKEYDFYLDSTPTHSYMKGLHKYPQAAYPYAQLVA